MLLNAIEHGNDRNPEKKVVLTIKNIRDMLFQISVTDEGAGFDHENIEISLLDKSRQFNPSGFSLIGSLCEQIGFNSSGNQVTVYIRNDPETRFEVEENQDTNVIRPSGNITAAVADRFRLLLIDLVEKGGTRFRFDFQKVEDIDSITLSVFVVFARMMSKKSRDAQLEIVNAGSDLVNLFKITRLDSKYEIFSAQSS
jgi:anti-anti-sigma factor